MHAMFASPRRAGGVRRAIPEGRAGLLRRAQFNRHVPVGVVGAFVIQRLRVHAGANALVRVDEHVARFFVIDVVIAQLERRHAAADADLQPAMAEMIEHGDFLQHPKWRIKRQQIAQRPQPHVARLARQRGEEQARRGRHVDGRGVMLGQMHAPEAGFIRRRIEFEPLVEKPRQRPVGAPDMVE